MTMAPNAFTMPDGSWMAVTRPTSDRGVDVEMGLRPGTGAIPTHAHPPGIHETFTVLEGTFELYVDGTWHLLEPGATMRVPPGTPHTFRNLGEAPCRVLTTHDRAGRFEEYVGLLRALSESGRVTRIGDPRTMLWIAAAWRAYDDTIYAVGPAGRVLSVLGWLASMLGFRVEAVARSADR